MILAASIFPPFLIFKSLSKVEEIPTVLNGLGIAIMSTPNGVMTGAKARKEQVGGEVIAYVW